MLERVWRKGNPPALLVGMVQPLQRTVWRFLKKLEIELPYDPAIPLLGLYPEKTIIQKHTCTPIFIAALFTIARTWKQPKCPSTEECIKKMWYIYTMEYYTWFFLRPIQEDYLEKETRGMTGFLTAEEGVSHQTRMEMYLTLPKGLRKNSSEIGEFSKEAMKCSG